jgi:hypothetical protein
MSLKGYFFFLVLLLWFGACSSNKNNQNYKSQMSSNITPDFSLDFEKIKNDAQKHQSKLYFFTDHIDLGLPPSQ